MRRSIAVLLCSGLAIAGDFVVRATVGVDPAPDAVVTIVKKDAGIVFDSTAVRADAKTDATGQAVVRVEPGDRVLVYKPGFALAVAETTGDVVDVELRPERVFEARVVDGEGKALGGVDVFLKARTRREATLRARTGDDGRAFVYGLWFDDYDVRVEKTGYGSQQSYPGDLAPLAVTLLRDASLAGVVLDRENNPVPGITVDLDGVEAKTDGNGAFRFDRCWAGESRGFELRVAPPYKGEVHVEPFRDGEQRTLPPLRVDTPVTLRARLLGEDEKPLAGVDAWDPASDRTESDASGRVVLRLLAGTPAGVTLRREDLVPEFIEVDPKGAGAAVDLGDIVLRTLPRIEVQVRHPDGTLVGTGRVGETELARGIATVVGDGDYGIVVEGYPPVTAFVRAPGPVSVTLPEPVWVAGRVVDFAGEPFRGISVESADAEVTTDEEGRFRLGPVHRDDFWIAARSGGVTRMIQATPGDVELEIRMPRSRPDLVRGRVVRGTEPVQRYWVNGQDVTDEEGRFEVMIDRASEDALIVIVADATYNEPLPPPGENVIVRLPAGRIEVALDGPGLVGLFLHGRQERQSRLADAGVVVFDGLEPGRYEVVEWTGAVRDVVLSRDGVVHVQLLRRERPTLTVVTAAGNVQRALAPGRHDGVRIDDHIELRGLAMPDGDLRIDLVTAESGALQVRGRPDQVVRVERRLERCSVVFDSRGESRFESLRVGAYDVSCDGARRRVTVGRGRTTTVVFDDPRVAWSGIVRFADDRPAAGAIVRLSLDDAAWSRETNADMRGRFRFAELVPGTYRCVIDAEDHVLVSRVVEVVEGAEEPLFVVRRPAGRVGFVDAAGTRLRAKHPVLVDGVTTETGPLGNIEIAGATARIDLDVPGYASLRGRVVRPGEVVRLLPGASLVLRTAVTAERLEVRVDGVRFDRFERGEGGFVLDDLPAGLAEIEIAPAEEREEPRIVRTTLRPGVETRVDLGG